MFSNTRSGPSRLGGRKTEFEKRWSRYARPVGGSWRCDETYIKVKGRWTYLYRAVDKQGRTVDFLLSERRDVAAAKRRSEEHTSELQSRQYLVCRLLLEKNKKIMNNCIYRQ